MKKKAERIMHVMVMEVLLFLDSSGMTATPPFSKVVTEASS